MIVVTVELHSAIDGRRRVLGRTIIANDGVSTDPARGNYQCMVGRKGQNLQQVHQKPARRGTVTNYPRSAYNVWRLVMRALNSAFPEETKTSKD